VGGKPPTCPLRFACSNKNALIVEAPTIYHDANTHYFRENDGSPIYLQINPTSTFIGSTIEIQNTGDVYLSLEADTNENDVNDNPLIQFKKRNVELGSVGLIADNTFVISSTSSSLVKVGGNVITTTYSGGMNIAGNTSIGGTFLINTSSATIDRIKTTKDTLTLYADGGGNIELSGTGTIYYDGSSHYFRDSDGSPTLLLCVKAKKLLFLEKNDATNDCPTNQDCRKNATKTPSEVC
jgi:hypothetical protein